MSGLSIVMGLMMVSVAPAEETPAPAPAPAPAPDPAAPTANGDGGPLPTAPPPSSPLDPSSTEPPSMEAEGASDEAEVAGADDTVEVAALPTGPAPPPHRSEPRAWGGAHQTPLPPAPDTTDASLTDQPWRGRFWAGVALHLSVPLGGEAPGAGVVVAPVPEASFGWRIRPFVGLHTAISNYAHDAAVRTVDDGAGGTLQEVTYGRITALDLVTARFYIPRPRRVEPWAEVGGGLGIRRGPLEARADAAGLLRVGSGIDLWLAPSLTLTPAVAYRMTVIDKTVGHGLRTGLDLSIHW